MDDLKPLTPEQQAEFDSHRHSESVVQHKCAGCGTWYETPRGSVDQQEVIDCSCGTKFSYSVPKLTKLVPLTNELIININDPDAKLDTGMTVREAVASARHWWEKYGRRDMKSHLKRQNMSPASNNKGMGGQFATLSPDDPNFLPSGIIHGQPWDALNKREQIQVVKVWHHFHIRKPDLLGDHADAEHQMQDRKLIQ